MELVLAERGLNSLSSDQVEGNAEKIILLNLSENNMNNSNLLDTFTSLETLILDKTHSKLMSFTSQGYTWRCASNDSWPRLSKSTATSDSFLATNHKTKSYRKRN